MTRAPISVVLYVTRDCHLCEDAQTTLSRLHRRHPHAVQIVDITSDPALLQRYGVRVPVLVAGGREYEAPLSASTLDRALAAASA